MTVKEQFKTLKENWLIAVVALVLIVVLMNGSNLMYGASNSLMLEKGYNDYAGGIAESSAYYGGTRSYNDGDFAPEVEDRKIIQTSSLSTEVKRGEYYEGEKDLKEIVDLSDSFLLSENVNDYGTGRTSRMSGSYQIKVNTEDYDSVVEQLKEIGEVKSFNNNLQDITGSYEDVSIEIGVEKSRLERYEEMYAEAKNIQDKLDLNDRIFNQERRIKYLEDRLNNYDKKVEYSTVSFSMSEERSSYASIALVKFGQLITDLVDSFNLLISLIFRVLPWIVAYFIVRIIYVKFKKK